MVIGMVRSQTKWFYGIWILQPTFLRVHSIASEVQVGTSVIFFLLLCCSVLPCCKQPPELQKCRSIFPKLQETLTCNTLHLNPAELKSSRNYY